MGTPEQTDPLAAVRELVETWAAPVPDHLARLTGPRQGMVTRLRAALATADEQVAALVAELSVERELSDAERVAADTWKMRAEKQAGLAQTYERRLREARAEVEHHRANYDLAMQRAHEGEAEVERLLEAIRFTQEYVQLPTNHGWSWWDAYRRHRPEDAERLRLEWLRAREYGKEADNDTE